MSTSLEQQFLAFRASHLYRQREIAGIAWRFLSSGQGDEALLLLPGAPGLGETSFQSILRWESRYRIIAPDYPAGVNTLAGLVDGLLGVLEAEGVQRAHVVGGSYSGMVAQCLARRAPERVGKLILSHTGVPRPGRAWLYASLYVTIAVLPLWAMRALLRLGLRPFQRSLTPEQAFWRGHFREVIARLAKADYLSRLRVLIDFDRRYRLAPVDALQGLGRTLIIEADADPLVSAEEARALRALYPQAQVYTFYQTAHAAWMTRAEDYLRVIETFFEEPVCSVRSPVL